MKLKILFFLIGAAAGFFIANPEYSPIVSFLVSVALGASIIGIAWASESLFSNFSPRAFLGVAIGLAVASMSFFALNQALSTLGLPSNIFPLVSVGFFLLLVHIGIAIGIKKGKESERSNGRSYGSAGMGNRTGEVKILDTSVIIDGRIADVAEAGFISGDIIIPKFIIKELQYIADSSDQIKKVRGRRGLDILKRMQKEIPNVSVRITNHNFPSIKEADLKLVELASKLKGVIITNDFNLNKVAGLQNVKVMNLNQLSNALKPVVLPGETLNIRVTKGGKEENQGVGYLEDGTMVVVDRAKRHLGDKVKVLVTSVLQTPTGRMIFSKVKENGKDMAPDLHG